MSVCLLRISDGRDEVHKRSFASLGECLPEQRKEDKVVEIRDPDHALGFAGAIAEGWRHVRESGCDWVFHAEMDFLYNAPIALDRMIAVLERMPKLVQLSLKRQPWNEREVAAGGIVEADPEDFTQVVDRGDVWTEHRRYFTTNPSLYSAALCAQGWPQERESEGKFTHRLLEDQDLRFGIWGAKWDKPLVEHIGERVGVGY